MRNTALFFSQLDQDSSYSRHAPKQFKREIEWVTAVRDDAAHVVLNQRLIIRGGRGREESKCVLPCYLQTVWRAASETTTHIGDSA